ncbi:glycosyltransferase family 2 protein [uncultured Thomasclavelia sp.]|uniref:glycosyltransferase family 2 protein n=1 Tax=uncultured Thomasclavelia sp. TaxID=3025759 RepID=UPI0026352807|nr:glycosyltransferase family 2 protein [uncultured Thomasclavelia sp.]
MDDLLSIIIPAYNIESYIGRCLESLIIQTYKNLEIIVVDDGSKDNTLSIIKEYCNKDNRINVIHKKNEGVSVARLTGMKKANGEYIGFVDGDDIVEKDMFEFLMNNAKKYGADISHCGYVMDFPDGHSDYYYNTGKIIIQNNFKGLKDLLEGKFVEPGLCNKIYKKTLIETYIRQNVMDYSIKNLEDLLVNYYLFKEAKLSIYEDRCKYHYTLRKSSAATNISRNKIIDPIKVFKSILNDNKSNNYLYNIVYRRYIAMLISNATNNPYKDLKNEAKENIKKEYKNVNSFKIGLKLKYMCFGIIYIYPIYRLVRIIYDRVTKIDKKYKV